MAGRLAANSFNGGTSRPPVDLRSIITEHPDFPKPGIVFRDFAPVLRNPAAMRWIADELERRFPADTIDVVVGIESRGFILGTLMATRYGRGLAMVRKAGKTPGKTRKISYSIEYGSDTIEMRQDALGAGPARVDMRRPAGHRRNGPGDGGSGRGYRRHGLRHCVYHRAGQPGRQAEDRRLSHREPGELLRERWPGRRSALSAGTGVYDSGVLKNAESISVETPYGDASDEITTGTFRGRRMAFLPRHGRKHTLAPHMINYRGPTSGPSASWAWRGWSRPPRWAASRRR